MDALDRLYRRIAERLADAPRDAGTVVVSVGDLYQSVVPYRLVRGEAGFGELAEYEHTLLRLLSGERAYVRLESEEAEEEIRRELEAPNPILGVYRDYADVGARLNPDVPPRPDDAPPAPRPASAPASPPVPSVAPAPPSMTRPRPASPASAAPGSPSSAPRPAPGPAKPARPAGPTCSGCRASLPADREVRFCPFCGKCLGPVPCAECSSMLEPDWRFCASCGWQRPAASGERPGERRLR